MKSNRASKDRKGPVKPRRKARSLALPAGAPPPPSEPKGDSAPPPREEEEEPLQAAAEKERASYDGDTAIKLYLREIGQVKLLTPEEEVELAARIKKGDKKAREQMIKANLRLVVKIAHDYENFGLPSARFDQRGQHRLDESGRAV